jgi:hypothetical protein
MPPPVAAWVRAIDYAAAIAAILWWEEGKGGRLSVVCQINADLHAGRATLPGSAEAA